MQKTQRSVGLVKLFTSKKEVVLRREVGQEGQRVRLTVGPGQAGAVSSATALLVVVAALTTLLVRDARWETPALPKMLRPPWVRR